MPKRSSNCWRRPGLTLLEVVAAILLLATLLAGILTGLARQSRQLRRADVRMQAVAAADALLTDWQAAGAEIPESASGGAGQSFAWRTTPVPDATAASLYSRVVRLEVFSSSPPAASDPLLALDLLVPLPIPQPAAPERQGAR